MEKKNKIKLLDGALELRIIQLVRRVHSAENCPHRGNCLNEDQMIFTLHKLLVLELMMYQSKWKAEFQEALRKAIKPLQIEGKVPAWKKLKKILGEDT